MSSKTTLKSTLANRRHSPGQLAAAVVLALGLLGAGYYLTPAPSKSRASSVNDIPGDINGDGKVDVFDLSILLANFGKSIIGSPPPTPLTPPPTPTPPPPTGSSVKASPSGPSAPSGGWKVEYADAFGSCLTGPGTGCSLGGSRSDNTLVPTNGAPSNSNEPTWYQPGQDVVDQNGLELNCTYQPGVSSGKNYACGEVTTRAKSPSGSGDPAGYKEFHLSPGHGETWAFETVAKAPPTTGEEDPAYWFTGYNWSWEIDNPEMWGFNSGHGGQNWCPAGDKMGFPSVPRSNSGGARGERQLNICQSMNNASPDQAYHTYTVVMSGTTFTSYIDGRMVSSGLTVGSTSSWAGTMGGIILQHSLRDVTVGNPSPYFKSGTRTYSVRSIAVYENASANSSNTLNGGTVAPGTTIVP